eukprot:jgi/Mesvir1/22547/Mv18562-RA.1
MGHGPRVGRRPSHSCILGTLPRTKFKFWCGMAAAATWPGLADVGMDDCQERVHLAWAGCSLYRCIFFQAASLHCVSVSNGMEVRFFMIGNRFGHVIFSNTQLPLPYTLRFVVLPSVRESFLRLSITSLPSRSYTLNTSSCKPTLFALGYIVHIKRMYMSMNMLLLKTPATNSKQDLNVDLAVMLTISSNFELLASNGDRNVNHQHAAPAIRKNPATTSKSQQMVRNYLDGNDVMERRKKLSRTDGRTTKRSVHVGPRPARRPDQNFHQRIASAMTASADFDVVAGIDFDCRLQAHGAHHTHRSPAPVVHTQDAGKVEPNCTAPTPGPAVPALEAVARQDDALDISISSDQHHHNPPREFRTIKDVDFGWPRNFSEKYKKLKVVGSGNFAIVYTAKELSSGMIFAVKSIEKLKVVMNPIIYDDVIREVACLRALDRALNVAFFYEAFEDTEEVKIVLEYCSGGDLMSRIREESRNQNFTEKRVARIIKSCLRMLSACHSNGIVHRDVKPDNMLFLDDTVDSPLKLTDFGLSTKCGPYESLSEFVGTPFFMAPEVFNHKMCQKSEVWAVGCIMYQLLCGSLPFKRRSVASTFAAIRRGNYTLEGPAWANVSSTAKELLQWMLTVSVHDRPTAKEALEHPWIRSEGNWSDKPLDWTMFQRMQQFSTMEHPKILQIMAQFLPEHGQIIQQSGDLFRQHDIDKDGVLNYPEFLKMIKKQKHKVTNTELEMLFKQIDINNDGAIDVQEFTTALLPWKRIKETGQWDEIVAITFKALDKDNSGTVDPVDISAYIEMSPEASASYRELSSRQADPVNTETGLTLSQFKRRFGLEAMEMMSLFEFDSRRPERISTDSGKPVL